MSTHQKLSDDEIREVVDHMMSLAEQDLREFGVSLAKFVIIPAPPSKKRAIMIANPDDDGIHPREYMGTIRQIVKEKEDQMGKGVIAGFAAISEAWMVKLDPEEIRLEQAMSISPSQHPERVEVVICYVATPYGENYLFAREILRGEDDGEFWALADGIIEEGHSDGVAQSVFNPWDDGIILDELDGYDGFSEN